MKYYHLARDTEIEEAHVDAFLAEIEAVCRRFQLSIGHEDSQGSFLIMPYSERNIEWLREAMLDT